MAVTRQRPPRGATTAAPVVPQWTPLASITVLALTAGLVAAGFWFVTTEVFSIKVSSGQWWFYLFAAVLALVLSTYLVERTRVHYFGKALMASLVLALVLALLWLGLTYRPMDSKTTPTKLGLVPALSGDDGLEVEEQRDDDADTVLLTGHSDTQYLPSAMDQGSCGSCWAVASATVLSARFARYKAEKGEPIPKPDAPVYNCAPAGIDMSGWHVSPQFLLDKDTPLGPPDACTESSAGKCNGNTQTHGFTLAMDGVPNAQCVPYFAAESKNGGVCPVACGSPVAPETVSCSTGTVVDECVHKDSFTWTRCTGDDSAPAPLVAEAYGVKHVIGEAAMKREISQHGPIVAGINFYTKPNGSQCAWSLGPGDNLWGKYSDMITPAFVAMPEMDSGDYHKLFGCPASNPRCNQCSGAASCGGHAVVIYGFGETASGVKYWQCRNSWGPNWGNSGDIKIQRGVDAWNIESYGSTALVREATNNTI